MDRGLIDTAWNGVSDTVRDGVDFLWAPSGNGEEAARFFDDDDLFVLVDDSQGW